MLKHMPELNTKNGTSSENRFSQKALAFSRITKNSKKKRFKFTENGAKLKNARSLTRSTSMKMTINYAN